MEKRRKSSLSHIMANERYNAKVYRQVAIRFKKEEDADILETFDNMYKNGVSKRALIREWYECWKEKHSI